MKRIEWFWNLVYYILYKFDIRLRKVFNYLNPFYLINNIPIIKKHHSKHGIDEMNEFADRILNNPRTGISIIWVGSFMGGLLVLLGYGFFNFLQILIGRPLVKEVWKDGFHFIIYLLILVVPSIIINNYLLFRKNKYLYYFKEFENIHNKKKTAYNWLILIVIILIFSFFIGSFIAL